MWKCIYSASCSQWGAIWAVSSCRGQYNPLSHIPQPQQNIVNTKYCKYCNADPRQVVTTLLHSSYWRLGAGLMWSCRDTLCCTARISYSQSPTSLHSTVLYCTVLYCTVLYCTALCCTVLSCTVLYCTALYLIVLVSRFSSQIRLPTLVKSLLVRSVRCYIILWRGTVLFDWIDPISSTLLWVFWNWERWSQDGSLLWVNYWTEEADPG